MHAHPLEQFEHEFEFELELGFEEGELEFEHECYGFEFDGDMEGMGGFMNGHGLGFEVEGGIDDLENGVHSHYAHASGAAEAAAVANGGQGSFMPGFHFGFESETEWAG